MVNEEKNGLRKRGRKSINADKKTSSRMITIYDNHFKIIDENSIELSAFVRWLLKGKQDEYTQLMPSTLEVDGGSTQTSVSLYKEDISSIKVNNLSEFIRYGLENYINEYTN